MVIVKDMAVVMEYTVRLEDGSWVKGEGTPVSLNFFAGYDQVLPALERRLTGLSEGTEIDFIIPALEAFGKYDETLVHKKTFTEYPAGRNLVMGKWVVATDKLTEAQYGFFVKDKSGEDVTLDFNHPLAGKDLHYHVKIIHVRPALREELEYLRPCEHGKEAEEDSAQEPAFS